MKLKGNFVLMGILCFKFEISAFWQNERTCCMGNLKFLEPRETERDPCKLTITIHTVELVGANASDIQCQDKKKKKFFSTRDSRKRQWTNGHDGWMQNLIRRR